MPHSLDDLVTLLSRTPAALDALLRDLPAAWTDAAEGPGTGSARDIVAHLIFGERTDWIPRAHRLLQAGETVAFEPFDMAGHVPLAAAHALPQLLDLFAAARRESLSALAALHLSPADLERTGRHPVLGVVTLSQLLATWAAHDLTHLHQLSRVLALQCRDDVGPWERFLGVLHCQGHSA
jgi:hypothetical protein